jgi:nitrate/nitrite transport system permease protein
MVAAVFHSPASPADAVADTPKLIAERADSTLAKSQKESKKTLVKATFDWRSLWLATLPPFIGIALLAGIWQLIAMGSKGS